MNVKAKGRTALAVRRLLVAAAFVLVAPASPSAIAQQQFTPQAEEPESFPDGPGRDEAFYMCAACHAFKLVASQGFSRERWDETIELMTERHGMAKLEGEDRKIILDYLAKAFPVRQQPRGFQNPFLKQ
jgi:hypothetical protein